jgi:hypothetical protein
LFQGGECGYESTAKGHFQKITLCGHDLSREPAYRDASVEKIIGNVKDGRKMNEGLLDKANIAKRSRGGIKSVIQRWGMEWECISCSVCDGWSEF